MRNIVFLILIVTLFLFIGYGANHKNGYICIDPSDVQFFSLDMRPGWSMHFRIKLKEPKQDLVADLIKKNYGKKIVIAFSNDIEFTAESLPKDTTAKTKAKYFVYLDNSIIEIRCGGGPESLNEDLSDSLNNLKEYLISKNVHNVKFAK